MKEKIAEIGVIVARFQVPKLTPAHRSLLDAVTLYHPKTLVVLGISPLLNSDRDPLDFVTRSKMVLESYPNVVILPLKDHRNDLIWSQNLDNLIRTIFPLETVCLYGGSDSFIKSYSGKFSVKQLMDQRVGLRGTEIRATVATEPLSSEDFRRGVIYGQANQYPKTVPCVDVAVFYNGKLMVGKKKGSPGYCFIGGHVEGRSLEATARMEVAEEANVTIQNLKYVGSFKLEDWRHKGEKSCIVTAFFRANHLSEAPRAGDDLDELHILDISSLNEKDFVPEHQPLFKALMKDLVAS